MMRSPRHFAVACRAPNGEIVLQVEPLEKTWIGRQQWLKLPFLRGSLALLDAMALGSKALKFASNVQIDPRYQADGEVVREQTVKEKRIQDFAVGATLVVGLGMGLFLFGFLPNLLAEQMRHLGVRSGTTINFVTELVKIAFFLGYIALIGQMKGIHDIFMYHGAEHKAINALEVGAPLTLENCRAQSRLHPRCGTSFAIVVLLVSLVLFTFVPRYPLTGGQGSLFLDVLVRFGLELLILPFVSGISYEIIRLAGKFRNKALVNVLLWPGLKSQYLTTREPNEAQIEVALTALRACVEAGRTGFATEEEPNAVESAPVPLP